MRDVNGRRVVLIILDGVGAGELPDAAKFGDEGSDTLGNLSRHFDDGLRLPNLGRLGLGNVIPLKGVPPVPQTETLGNFGKCAEVSQAKDSTSGHWEITGVVTPRPYPTYPNGFPPEVMDRFELLIGRGTLGNKPASGTEIIKELGEEHLRTGKPIVYTSADSVFQIAAHEDVYSTEDLYRICRLAREMLTGEHSVSRVIARPFVGKPGAFTRTAARKDFSIEPPEDTLLDRARAAGLVTLGIGKIGDLFAHRGLSQEIHTKSNQEGIDATIETMRDAASPSFVFVNLVEFDQAYGHRNDPEGFRRTLEEFDARLPQIMAAQRPGDLMLITSDHGTDPTTPSTDHSREYTPLLAWGKNFAAGRDLGVRSTYADVGQTIAEYLHCGPLPRGRSFLSEISPTSAPVGR